MREARRWSVSAGYSGPEPRPGTDERSGAFPPCYSDAAATGWDPQAGSKQKVYIKILPIKTTALRMLQAMKAFPGTVHLIILFKRPISLKSIVLKYHLTQSIY